MSDVNIMAIDPGDKVSGWVLFNGSQLLGFGITDNYELMTFLREHVFPRPTYFVCEEIKSYGMSVGATTIETIHWSGRFVQAVYPRKMGLIPRVDCKKHVCHNGGAKDANVRQALIDRFGPQGTKRQPGVLYGVSKDVWAALAVAVTFYDRLLEEAA